VRDDGGPAFPDYDHNGVNQGMSMRDYFAAKAMADVLHHFNWEDDSIARAAEMAYQLADAMLKERSK
jgi:hypothetical protein